MSTAESIFETLPGLEVPVAKIAGTLAHIWETPDTGGYASPSEFRASQMNLIVHFGRESTAGEAGEVFATALRFSQRYPSRILILCPEDRGREDVLLASKIFSECYIGKSGRDRSCCEAIVLAYPVEGKNFLENQVSILLETDLPTYYWIHRFQAVEKIADYSFFLNIARRIVFDSGIESSGIAAMPVPRPDMVRDLVDARMLPIRQSIGQFLSGFSPAEIVDGLTGLETGAGERSAPEARCLLDWMQKRLRACAEIAERPLDPDCTHRSLETGASDFSIRLIYSDRRFFHWQGHPDVESAVIEADLGRGRVHLPTALKLLRPENALGEAFFF